MPLKQDDFSLFPRDKTVIFYEIRGRSIQLLLVLFFFAVVIQNTTKVISPEETKYSFLDKMPSVAAIFEANTVYCIPKYIRLSSAILLQHMLKRNNYMELKLRHVYPFWQMMLCEEASKRYFLVTFCTGSIGDVYLRVANLSG